MNTHIFSFLRKLLFFPIQELRLQRNLTPIMEAVMNTMRAPRIPDGSPYPMARKSEPNPPGHPPPTLTAAAQPPTEAVEAGLTPHPATLIAVGSNYPMARWFAGKNPGLEPNTKLPTVGSS